VTAVDPPDDGARAVVTRATRATDVDPADAKGAPATAETDAATEELP
jgi:hypothetical protein